MCDLDNFNNMMARKNDEYERTVEYYSSAEKRKEKNEKKGFFLKGDNTNVTVMKRNLS
jgi:hypothetical protein